MTPYQISPEAENDLFEIWQRISNDSVELANESKRNSIPSSSRSQECRRNMRRILKERP